MYNRGNSIVDFSNQVVANLMYDTINFKITETEAGGVDFIHKTACYLDNVAFHEFNGMPCISGNIGGLRVFANEFVFKIKDGSLCKWFLGDNLQTMSREDTHKAIEKLSDTLHLPLDRAIITRLDVAQNITTKHPTDVYLNHLGALRYAKRFQNIGSLYYTRPNQILCFYDKIKEVRAKKMQIPKMYDGRHVLRYEQRYLKSIPKQLRVETVYGAMLYDEAFYISLLQRWIAQYQAIKKVNDITLNFEAMNTKKDLSRFGVLALVKYVGGEVEMIGKINEARATGKLTKKQAFDLRQAVREACEFREGIAVESEVISELDKKMLEAVEYYR